MTTKRTRRDIDRANVRKSDDPVKGCPPRHEPYWGAPLGKGRVVGFRRIDATTGSWIARMRDETGRKVYKALGAAMVPPGDATPVLDYEQAQAEARKWFGDRKAGVDDDKQTVADACRAYVEERRKSKSEANAHDAEKRFERTVYGKPIAGHRLVKLDADRVQQWRDGLKLSPGATNRTLTALKAALYLAISRRKAPSELREELRKVKPLPGGNKRRELYLTLKDRRALLKAAHDVGPAARDLLEAAALTGARAGELTRATVSQFNAREGTMAFITGKQRKNGGRRDVPLSPAAVRLFKRLAEGKAGDARLFLRDDGTPWAHSDWDEPIREAAKAAKLPAEPRTGVCAYTLRHCWITDTLRAGMSVLEVARLAGTSVQMLNDHYGHLVAHAARAKLAKVRLT